MITKLYSLYDTPIDHDVCHLFEHLVLRSFLLKLNERGYNRAFFGWLRGSTIDSTIFFDLGAYTDEIAYLFDHHLKSLGRFDATLINQSIAHVEAEMNSTLEIVDEASLSQQLELLTRIARDEDTNTATVSYKSPLRATYKSDLFEEVGILVNVFSPFEKTQKAFLALHPVILDILRDAAIDRVAAYPTGKSALAINEEGIGIAWRFNVKKNVSIKTLENDTNKYLKEFKLVDYIKYINLYRHNIIDDSSCNTRLIQFYEQTGLQCTREELVELVTDVQMVNILNNMTVRFSSITGKMKKIEWDY